MKAERQHLHFFHINAESLRLCVQKVDGFCDVPNGATVGESCRERDEEQ